MAAELAGLESMPCIVREMSRDEAIIAMVDANLQRETILPSEKAKSYQMKLEAMKRQAGKPSKDNYVPVGHNFEGKPAREILAENSPDSNTQILRFSNRLTGVVIDRFGKDISMRPDGDKHFTVTVNVEVSPQFFGWLCGLGKAVKLVSPAPIVERLRGYVKGIAVMYEKNH